MRYPMMIKTLRNSLVALLAALPLLAVAAPAAHEVVQKLSLIHI